VANVGLDGGCVDEGLGGRGETVLIGRGEVSIVEIVEDSRDGRTGTTTGVDGAEAGDQIEFGGTDVAGPNSWFTSVTGLISACIGSGGGGTSLGFGGDFSAGDEVEDTGVRVLCTEGTMAGDEAAPCMGGTGNRFGVLAIPTSVFAGEARFPPSLCFDGDVFGEGVDDFSFFSLSLSRILFLNGERGLTKRSRIESPMRLVRGSSSE